MRAYVKNKAINNSGSGGDEFSTSFPVALDSLGSFIHTQAPLGSSASLAPSQV